MSSFTPDCLVKALRSASCTSAGITFIQGEHDEDFCSYGDFLADAEYCLHNLRTRGVVESDEVVLQLDDNRKFLTVFWACILGRMIPVPLSPKISADQRLKLLKVWQQLKSPWYVAEHETLDKLQQADNYPGEVRQQLRERFLSVAEISLRSFREAAAECSPQDIAYIQYSSGSTGDPKGVVLTHDNLCANVIAIIKRSRATSQDSILSWMPLTHDMGMICFHLTGVFAAISQYVMPTALFIRRPLLWIQKASDKRITQLYSPNFGLQFFLSSFQRQRLPDWDLSSVRILFNGAEQISAKICNDFTSALEPFHFRPNTIFPGYGLAEASVAVSLPDPGDSFKTYTIERSSLVSGQRVRFNDNHQQIHPSFVEVGYPVDDCEVRITDKGKELEAWHQGMIEVRGRNVTAGYYGQANADRCSTDWLATGDLGFMAGDRLVITGRIKNTIILNGTNYFPHDLENILFGIPGVELGHVAVTWCRNEKLQREELIVFVISNQRTFPELQSQIRDRLAREAELVADHVIPVKRLPKTTSGKVQYFQLRERFAAGEFTSVTADATATTSLHDRYLQLLEKWLPGTSPEVPFLEAGLSSLQQIRIVAELNTLADGALTIADILELRTPAALLHYMLQEHQKRLSRPGISKAPSKPSFPALPLQQKLWAIEQDEQRAGAFNISFLIESALDLDVKKIQVTFDKLTVRHPALRAGFMLENQGLRMFLRPQLPASYFSVRNCSDIEFARRCDDEANTRFSLAKDPLVRVVVWTLNDRRIKVQFTLHHIITDGWSIHQLMQEFFEIYDTNVTYDTEAHLAITDYCDWYDQVKNGGWYQTGREFWTRQFREGVPAIQLPFQRWEKKQSFQSRSINMEFSRELVMTLDNFVKAHNVSRSSVVTAIVHCALQFHTHQERIVTGVEVANRAHADTHLIHGPLINTVLLQSRFEPSMDLIQFSKSTHQQLMHALAYEFYAIEDVAGDLRDLGTASTTALFNILIIYQNLEGIFENAQASLYRLRRLETGRAINDMTFEFNDLGASVELALQYDTGLFTEAEITSFVRHFYTIAQRWLGTPEASLSRLSVLSKEDEARQILIGSGKRVAHKEIPVSKLIAESCLRFADHTAIVYKDIRMPYRGLAESVQQVGAALSGKYRIAMGARVAVFGPVTDRTVIMMLALWKIGGVYVPIDPNLPELRLEFQLTDSDVQLVYCDQPENLHWLTSRDVCSFRDLMGFTGEPHHHSAVDSYERPAYILYTSGSTGTPKGVVCRHNGLSDYVQTFCSLLKVHHSDVVMQQASINFDTSLEEILPSLACGATVVIAPDGGKDVLALLDLMLKEKASILSTTPSVIGEINDIRPALEHLRVLIAGGERLESKHITNLLRKGLEVYNSYGPTESTICATYGKVEQLFSSRIPIGKPMDNKTIYLLDEWLRLVPTGEKGEICIGGIGLADGYLNRQSLTEERFIENPFRTGERLYRSGDLGRWREDGELDFIGRNDHQVKIRGYRVECEEIEGAIGQLGAKDCAVVPVTDHAGDLFLAAFIVGFDEPADHLRVALLKRLPSYMVPEVITNIEKLPRNANGKIDRQRLPKVATIRTDLRAAALTSAAEKQLAAVWEEVLGKNIQTGTANFLSEGGHSLKVIRLISRIQKEFGVRLTLKDVYQYPDLRSMAVCIQGNLPESQSAIGPAPEQNSYPLSHAQKRLWAIYQRFPDTPAYVLLNVYDIIGVMKVERMKSALASLVDRFENLRTIFKVAGGEPRQVVLTSVAQAFEYTYLDLRDRPDRIDLLEGHTKNQSTRIFDLTKGPLVRLHVLHKEANEYRILLAMDHIIADGWSVELLLKDLVSIAVSEDGKIPRHTATLQYKDYTVWQQTFLQSGLATEMSRFWKSRLLPPPPALMLPTDFAPQKQRTFDGGQMHFVIPEHIRQGLQSLANASGTSFYATLLSSVFALLFRESEQSDMIVGTIVAGRDHPDVHDQIGLFVNTIPSRIEVDETESFGSLIQKVRQFNVDSYPHREYPFDCIIEDLALAGDGARTPLFGVAMSYDIWRESLSAFEQLSVNKVLVQQHTSKFDLTFHFMEMKDLLLQIEYSSDLFTERTITRFYRHLERLISYAIEHPGVNLRQIPLLSPREVERFAVGTTANDNDDDDTLRALTEARVVHKIFEGYAATVPQREAVSCNHGSLTYAELNRRSDEMAYSLQVDHHVRKGDFVALQLPRDERMIIYMLAVLKAGASYVPLPPDLPQPRLHFILNVVRPKLVIQNPGQPAATTTFVFVSCDNIAAVRGRKPYPVDMEADDIAYVMYTSGSTGKPKGVVIPHRGIVRLVRNTNYMSIHAEDRLLQLSNPAFDGSTFDIYGALLNGATVCIPSSQDLASLKQLKYFIERHSVNITFITTALFNSVVDECPDMLEHFRRIYFGGEAYSMDHIQKALRHVRVPGGLVHVYGPTESTTFSTYYPIAQADVEAGIIPIGRPISNTSVYVMDQEMNVQPEGVVGEICIGGEGLALGYLHRADLTTEQFVRHPTRPEERLYRTGDFGYWLDNGALVFKGRADNQVKIRGHRIECGEIEFVLRQAGATQALVVPQDSVVGNERFLVAYVTGVEEHARAAFQSNIQEQLPAYMVPSAFLFIEKFLLNVNGKIDHSKLPRAASGQSVDSKAPLTKSQKALAALWKSILGVEDVGIDDDFFALGGHSLRAMRLCGGIDQVFHKEVTIRDIFQNPSLRKMCDFIEATGGSQPIADKRSDTAYYPLSRNQYNIWIADQRQTGRSAYNIAGGYRLSGPVADERLVEALRMIWQRHESLRAVFRPVNGDVVQYCLDANRFDRVATTIDWRNTGDRQADINDTLTREAVHTFDLSQGPLLRATIIRIAEEERILLLNMHHMVSDGWSIEVFLSELYNNYQSLCQSENYKPAPLAFQYRDFVQWQSKYLESAEGVAAQEFWLEQFREGLHDVDLSQFIFSSNATGAGHVMISFDPTVMEAVEGRLRELKVSPYVYFAVAWKAFLSKITGQTSVTVGTPAANRGQQHMDQIGCYANTLLMRSSFDHAAKLSSIMQDFREHVTACLRHGNYPFSELISQLKREKIPVADPPFSVGFSWFDYEENPWPQGEISMLPMEEPEAFAKAVLWLNGMRIGQEWRITFTYDRSMITPETASILAEKWKKLIALLAVNSQVLLADLDLSLPQEMEFDQSRIFSDIKFDF